MEKPTLNNMAGSFGESLKELDCLLSEFKGHPMYSEWLEIDEATILQNLCEQEPEDAVDCQYADLIEESLTL